MKDTIYRQDAIDAMMRLQAEDDEAYGCHIVEGFDGERAREALEQLPSAQPKPCKDAVSKAEVLEVYADLYDVFDDNKMIQKELHKVYDKLNDLPSAQPERKTGRWILWNYPGEECAICSACGEEYDQMELYIGGNDYPKYCPDCGARMDDDIPMEYFENGGI